MQYCSVGGGAGAGESAGLQVEGGGERAVMRSSFTFT